MMPLSTQFKFRSWYWYDDREGYWDYTDDPASRPGQRWSPNPLYIPPPERKASMILHQIVVSAETLVNTARQMLDNASRQRREVPGFDVSANKDPNQDWAAACIIIDQAIRNLDEALPAGQKQRTQAAVGALRIGVDLLEAALGSRGVFLARLSLGATEEQPVPPPFNPASPFGRRETPPPAELKGPLDTRGDAAAPGEPSA